MYYELMLDGVKHLTSHVIMVEPSHFGFNLQTAATNTFQHALEKSGQEVRSLAMREFSEMVRVLRKAQITVQVLKSPTDVLTPDAVFPNNWFSHHIQNTVVVYPMLAENRRQERQVSALVSLLSSFTPEKQKVIDLSADESTGAILEGTGSMVLDRVSRVAFAMESPRTTKKEFEKWCKLLDYEGVFFHAYDTHKLPIYHTNVIMSIGEQFVVACLESVTDDAERKRLINRFATLGKEFIPISLKQVASMCGNILQVMANDGKRKIVMSENAYQGFTDSQRKSLEAYGEIVSVAIPTIETVGGGSARCMLAEIFI